jgi:uncharacterized protein (DUF4415 family)
MARKENIVSYTAEELDAMRARGEDRTDWAAVDAKTDAQIAADTASDPAWAGIPEDWYKDAVARSGPLVRPKENKLAVHIRFDADIVEFFKRSGRGWQSRMNAVLRSYKESQHG